MNHWKLIAAFGLLSLAVFVLLIVGPDNAEAGMPSQSATYVDYTSGSTNCSMCHTEWAEWKTTPHARAYPDLMNNSHNASYCKPCHTVGAGKPAIYPATGYNITTNLPVYLQNVSCQACHGPASEHLAPGLNASERRAAIGLVLNASLCGSCHNAGGNLSSTHHPTYDEWELSGHNFTQAPNMQISSCARCKEAGNAILYLETGETRTVLREAGEDAPITWGAPCVVCHDPHDVGTGSQLRVPVEDICQKCHTQGTTSPGKTPHHPQGEVRNNTAGYLDDRTNLDYMSSVNCADCHMATNLAGLPNHTFAPNPAACVVCHPTIYPDVDSAQAYIDDTASEILTKLDEAAAKVQDAKSVFDQMMGNRTTQNLTAWKWEYNVASFNEHTIESDKSDGNHNPLLANALLDDAITKADAIIANLTPPAKITGIETNSEAGGQIRVNWTASTATDFAKYRIYVLTSSKTNITSDVWTLEISDKSTTTALIGNLTSGSTYYVYVTAVDAKGNEITNTVSGASVTAGAAAGIDALTLGILAIVVLAMLALLAIVLMKRKKGGKQSPEELKEETPETK